MADDSFARDEPQQESWEERLRRITNDTRQIVVATRELIVRSRASLARADESLRRRRLVPK